MTKINDNNIENIPSEFSWDEEKLLNKIIDENTPSFNCNKNFKEKLDKTIKNRIELAKEQFKEKQELDSIPSRLKWRFYITWFWYAVCGFLFLFLIWFCTDLFTWTLKVPQKFSYTDNTWAFWHVAMLWTNNEYKLDEIKWYDEDWITYKTTEEESIEELSTNREFAVSDKLLKFNAKNADINGTHEDYVFNSVNTVSYDMDNDSMLNNQIVHPITYRFSYKDKLFPKLLTEYPIYKSSWILMRENASNQIIKLLKIWNIDIKHFTWLEIQSFELSQIWNNWYNISFSANDKSLSFYPNSQRQTKEYEWKLPTNKQIIKSVENKLRQFWISTQNYGDWIADIENFDYDMWIIQIFYPFEVQWKSVWNPDANQQIWMHIAYDINVNQIVSILNYDIATYEASNYTTMDKQEIEIWIEEWWQYYFQWALHSNSTVVLFDSMETVYLEKIWEDWNIYYVPAIKWEVSTSVDNYIWPKYIFQEIVK